VETPSLRHSHPAGAGDYQTPFSSSCICPQAEQQKHLHQPLSQDLKLFTTKGMLQSLAVNMKLFI